MNRRTPRQPPPSAQRQQNSLPPDFFHSLLNLFDPTAPAHNWALFAQAVHKHRFNQTLKESLRANLLKSAPRRQQHSNERQTGRVPPVCKFWLKGICSRKPCRFTHSNSRTWRRPPSASCAPAHPRHHHPADAPPLNPPSNPPPPPPPPPSSHPPPPPSPHSSTHAIQPIPRVILPRSVAQTPHSNTQLTIPDLNLCPTPTVNSSNPFFNPLAATFSFNTTTSNTPATVFSTTQSPVIAAAEAAALASRHNTQARRPSPHNPDAPPRNQFANIINRITRTPRSHKKNNTQSPLVTEAEGLGGKPPPWR